MNFVKKFVKGIWKDNPPVETEDKSVETWRAYKRRYDKMLNEKPGSRHEYQKLLNHRLNPITPFLGNPYIQSLYLLENILEVCFIKVEELYGS